MICPSCGRKVLSPILKSRPYMIIKESVTQNELELETIFPLAGKNKYGYAENTASYYLSKELGMVGLNLNSMSLSCLFLHQLPKSRRTKVDKEVVEKCYDFSMSEVIKAAQNMKIVLLMGAEVVRTFVGHGVSDVSGLVCKSELLPNVPIIIPAPNSDKIMAQPIGELRNALKTFAEQIQIYEAYMKV